MSSRGVFPYLVTEEGSVGESIAIARYMCNSRPDAGLYGSTVQDQAYIDEIIERHTSAYTRFGMAVLAPILGFYAAKDAEYKEAQKNLKDYVRLLDGLLKDKEFFYGDKLTLADVYLATSFNLFFALYLDAGFRKAVPNFSAWYERVRNNDVIVSVLGKPRLITKPLKAKTE